MPEREDSELSPLPPVRSASEQSAGADAPKPAAPVRAPLPMRAMPVAPVQVISLPANAVAAPPPIVPNYAVVYPSPNAQGSSHSQNYSQSGGTPLGRPGVVGVVGVVSIILASLSFLAAAVTLLQVRTITMVARRTGSYSKAMATTTPSAAGAGFPSSVNGSSSTDELPGGWDFSRRQKAITGLNNMKVLTVGRTAQLDALLARAGSRMLVVRGDVSPASVTATIKTWGIRASANPNQSGPDYFVTTTGQIELYDDHGVFYPDNRSGTVRVAVNSKAYEESLSDHNPINGQMPTKSGGAVNTTAAPAPILHLRALLIINTEAGISFLAAVLLMIAGICTVRDAGIARRLHLIYATIKLPLAAVGIYGWWWLLKAAQERLAPGSPLTLLSVVNVVTVCSYVMIGLGAIYPLVLLGVLNGQRVRKFYRELV